MRALAPALLFLAMPVVAAPADRDPVIVTGHAWAPFFSPMGEPFRARSGGDDTLVRWFRGADRDGNGWLTLPEMAADADRFFAIIDEDGDGRIGPTELMHYEWDIAPDVQLGSKTRYRPGEEPKRPAKSRAGRPREDEDLQGAARYSLLNLPEPVAAADSNFDRDVTLAEFRRAAQERFALLDKSGSGSLSLRGLADLLPPDPGIRSRKRKDAVDQRVGNPVTSN